VTAGLCYLLLPLLLLQPEAGVLSRCTSVTCTLPRLLLLLLL